MEVYSSFTATGRCGSFDGYNREEDKARNGEGEVVGCHSNFSLLKKFIRKFFTQRSQRYKEHKGRERDK